MANTLPHCTLAVSLSTLASHIDRGSLIISLPSISVLAMKSCKAKRIRSSSALGMVLYYCVFCALYTVESPPIIIPGSVVIQTDSIRALGLLGISNAGGGMDPRRHAVDSQDLRNF